MTDQQPHDREVEAKSAKHAKPIWSLDPNGELWRSDDVETINDIEQLASSISCRTAFRENLRDFIMQPTAAPAVGNDRFSRIWSLPLTHQSPHRNVSHRPVMGLFATLLLVAVLSAGMFVVLRPSRGNDELGAGQINPTPPSTPIGNSCIERDLAGGQAATFAAATIPQPPGIDANSFNGTHVQLQKWSMEVGGSLNSANTHSGNSGLTVDVVLKGTYSATFDAPVLVHGNTYVNPGATLVLAGESIELSHGDTVAYAFGTSSTLKNTSAGSNLDLLRLLILTQPDTGTLPSFATKVSQTDLPERLGSIFGSHPGAISFTLAGQEGIATDSTVRTLCDDTHYERLLASPDATAKSSETNLILVWMAAGATG